MCLGERIIEGHSFFRCRNRTRKNVGVGLGRILTQKVIGICQTCVSTGVARIVNDGLGEQIEGTMETIGRSLIPLVSATQIEIVGQALLSLWNGKMGNGMIQTAGQKTAQLTGKGYSPQPNCHVERDSYKKKDETDKQTLSQQTRLWMSWRPEIGRRVLQRRLRDERRRLALFGLPLFLFHNTSGFEPAIDFVGVGINRSFRSSRHAVDRQPAISSPPLDGSVGFAEVRSDIFPSNKAGATVSWSHFRRIYAR
jgi:hypothetical protein